MVICVDKAHTYDIIKEKCPFEHCRARLNVTDAILEKNVVMVLVLFHELI